MNKTKKDILKQVRDFHEGLLSPAQMINSIAKKNTKAVENLILSGYLERVPQYKPSINGTQKHLFYRITEKGINVFNPWYKKLWFVFKDDIRNVIISIITAIITTVIMTLLVKLFT